MSTPTLRERTVLGPYRIEVWEEEHLGCSRLEVYQDGKLVAGPMRYTWLHQALEVAAGYAARYRHQLGIGAP